MGDNHISTKTGGINDVAGYYVSSCCRSEVFLGEKEKKPRCPECDRATEWGLILRRLGSPRPSRMQDARQDERRPAPEGLPRLSRIEWGGFGLDDVHVVNYSQTGIAVEVSEPAIFFGDVALTLENGELVPGVIKHCRPSNAKYVLGIVCHISSKTEYRH